MAARSRHEFPITLRCARKRAVARALHLAARSVDQPRSGGARGRHDAPPTPCAAHCPRRAASDATRDQSRLQHPRLTLDASMPPRTHGASNGSAPREIRFDPTVRANDGESFRQEDPKVSSIGQGLASFSSAPAYRERSGGRASSVFRESIAVIADLQLLTQRQLSRAAARADARHQSPGRIAKRTRA